MFPSLLTDVRHGFRALLAKPGFTLAAVLTLAFGIGVNTALFSVINAVVLDPLPYPNPERLVSIAQANSDTDRNPTNVGYSTFADWQRELHSFASMAVFADWQASIATSGDAQMVDGMRVTPEFFSVLGVAPMLGRMFTDAEDQSAERDVVVLGAGLWRRQFGADPNVIGRKLDINGRDRTVIGVLPDSFRAPSYGNAAVAPEIWVPLGYRISDPFACRDCLHLQAIARLNAGVDLRTARAELDTFGAKLLGDYPNAYPRAAHFVATPLQSTLIGTAPASLWLLFAGAALVLLIACVDVGNLILVRAQTRERELALRSALGARRGRLAQLLLSESALIAAAGGALGLVIAVACMRALVHYANASLPRLDNVALDTRVLAFTLFLSAVVALLTGLSPAWRASRLDLDATLRAGARASGGTRTAGIQHTLVVAQIALALILAIGATLVLRSFAGLLRTDPGFSADNVTGMNLATIGPRYTDPAQVGRFYEQLIDRVRASPSVESASLVSSLPLSGNYDRAGFHIKDRPIPNQEAPEVDRYFVTPGYFSTMRIPLLRGRDFSATDRPDSERVAIVGDALARTMWPNEDAIGKRIQLGGRDEAAPWATIVGIVGDVRQYGLDTAATPQAYLAHAQQPADPVTLLVRSPLPAEAVAALARSAVRSIDSAVPVYAVASMDRRISDSLARRRVALTLFALFALTALALAAIGIYGVVSFTVAQNTQALGLRRALGASDARVWAWVLRRSTIYAGLGMLIGIPCAFAWSRLLVSELVGVSQHDPLSFAGACVLLVGIVMAASIAPARRALRVAPTVALRYE